MMNDTTRLRRILNLYNALDIGTKDNDTFQDLFFPFSLTSAMAKAELMLPYASYNTQRGNQTHSILKKKRYNHLDSVLASYRHVGQFFMCNRQWTKKWVVEGVFLHVHPIGRVKVGVPTQPFGRKSHEPNFNIDQPSVYTKFDSTVSQRGAKE